MQTHTQTHTIFTITIIILTLVFQSHTSFAFNFSNIHLSSSLNLNTPPPPPSLLKDVLKEIKVKQNWTDDDEDVIRVRDVDIGSVRVGRVRNYECKVKLGKSEVVVRMSDKEYGWRRVRKGGGSGGGWGGGGGGGKEFGKVVEKVKRKMLGLRRFTLEGPVEVSASDGVSVRLPKNITHTGLRRLLVGEGIAIEVTGAQEISIFDAYNFGFRINRTLQPNDRSHYWPFIDSVCSPFPPIRIIGSASLVAYRIRNPNAVIETKYSSENIIEMLPEECYTRHSSKKRWFPKLAILEKLMKSLIDERILQNGVLRVLKADIRESTLIWFELEVERDGGEKDALSGTLTAWKTRPRTERAHFDVVARVEEDRLRPLLVKKFKPFISSDSTAWSTIMSNVSFTKFPSHVVPPEPLTLDVKW